MSIQKGQSPAHRRKKTTLCVRQWAKQVWSALDTPKSLACSLASDRELVGLTVNPKDYVSLDPRGRDDTQLFFRDYQAVKLLSKYPSLKTGFDLEAVALEKFLECEAACAKTNERFRNMRRGIPEFQPDPTVGKVIYLASQKIATILGDCPTFAELPCGFGPGATVSVRGDTSVYKKLCSTSPECTIALARKLPELAESLPAWSLEWDQIIVVPGAELSFVPKDAKTDRPICIEPMINGFVQKGIGTYMKQRLRRFGVDLYDQSVNTRMVSRAHSHGLSTVDFSSASDTIASEVVLYLLPEPWLELLDVSRSPFYARKGSKDYVELEKFSSMGNGFTFELESLIFYALACACCQALGLEYRTQETLHVYGDDVIIPRLAFDLFSKVASFCGFAVNVSKSYKEGNFFESCGSDWFKGTPVRPLLLKRRPRTVKEFYYLANLTLEMASRALGAGCPQRVVDGLLQAHAWVISRIPRGKRLLAPLGKWAESPEERVRLGNNSPDMLGLWADFDVALPVRHACWDGYLFRALVEIPKPTPYPRDKGVPFSFALYRAKEALGNQWWDAPKESPDCDGYAHRLSPRVDRRVISFHPGPWPRLAVQWSERALGLVR